MGAATLPIQLINVVVAVILRNAIVIIENTLFRKVGLAAPKVQIHREPIFFMLFLPMVK